MNLKCIMLRERLKRLHMEFHLYDILEKGKLQEQKSRSWLPEIKGLGVWRGADCQEAQEIFGVMELFCVLVMMVIYYTTVCVCQSQQNCTLNMVTFTTCQLHLNVYQWGNRSYGKLEGSTRDVWHPVGNMRTLRCASDFCSFGKR